MKPDVSSELADVVIRDFRIEPIQIAPPPAVLAAVMKLVPQERWRRQVLVLNPAAWPKNIIDSTADAYCDACEKPCWMAPSSRAAVGESTLICMGCVERAAL